VGTTSGGGTRGGAKTTGSGTKRTSGPPPGQGDRAVSPACCGAEIKKAPVGKAVHVPRRANLRPRSRGPAGRGWAFGADARLGDLRMEVDVKRAGGARRWARGRCRRRLAGQIHHLRRLSEFLPVIRAKRSKYPWRHGKKRWNCLSFAPRNDGSHHGLQSAEGELDALSFVERHGPVVRSEQKGAATRLSPHTRGFKKARSDPVGLPDQHGSLRGQDG